MNIKLMFSDGTCKVYEDVESFYPSDQQSDSYVLISKNGVGKFKEVNDFLVFK